MAQLNPEVMRRALRLARKGYGSTSPNPMVGAVLVKGGEIIGEGWHRRAGGPHAEVEALRDAEKRVRKVRGATLYVTLEPCSTHGRTPPCVDAILNAGIGEVIVGARDPNPRHSGRGLALLRQAGIAVTENVLATEAAQLNEPFNHWIVHGTPWVTVKAAMTLDGKIATSLGESKWITGEQARQAGMRLRLGADAILVGVNTIVHDDPLLTCRVGGKSAGKILRRIVLDPKGRIPLQARVLTEGADAPTTVVVTDGAPQSRLKRLEEMTTVFMAPQSEKGKIDLRWLLGQLGSQQITSLLVEGGGETNASFLLDKLAHRIAFFYAPKILGGAGARKAVSGLGIQRAADVLQLAKVRWQRVGADLLLTAHLG